MSAIEELNKLKVQINSFLEEEILEPNEELNKALDEAIIALEQKEKIKDIQDWLDSIIFNIEDLNYDSEEEYVKDLKIVNRKLKRLVEGVEK